MLSIALGLICGLLSVIVVILHKNLYDMRWDIRNIADILEVNNVR